MDECSIVFALGFPSNEERTKSVVPGVCSLHDPSSRFLTVTTAARFFSPTTDVGAYAASRERSTNVRVVVALVEAGIDRPSRSSRGANHDLVEHFAHHPFVVHIGAGNFHGQRDAATVRQNVPFDAQFAAVGGILAGQVPPFGAFTIAPSSEAHCQSMPSRAS